MHSLRIARQAQADLEDIQHRSMTEFGVEVARSFMAGFDKIFLRLRDYPLVGRPRPEFGRNIRGCLHPPYVVLYRYEADVISILRILHTARRTQRIGTNTG